MQPKLHELGVMLNQQLPILVSFVFLRTFSVAVSWKVLKAILPYKLKVYVDKSWLWIIRFRNSAMTLVLANLSYQIVTHPPNGVCKRYDAVRAQGNCAMLALAVILTSNNVMASGIAIAALRAVSTASASSIFLASAASVVSTSSPQLFLYMYVFFWVALAHAVYCHDDLSPTETHGSIIAVLTMMLHALVCGAVLVCERTKRILGGMLKRKV